jgi:hypothetical protein
MLLLARTTTSSTPNPKLLARQWLALYQQGPVWVPPLIHTGLLSNLFLAFSSSSSSHWHATPHEQSSSSSLFFESFDSFTLHLAAAALTLSILPLTFVWLEPGINGACKWKAEMLLREEGFSLPERKRGSLVAASVVRHSASETSKRWAEGAEMGELVVAWAGRNHVRWVLGIVAGVVSFAASSRS